MSAAEPTTHAPLRHRCIVWHSGSTVPDPDLIAALMTRRMHVVACSNSFDALAHVCSAARESARRGPRSACPTTIPATILVLCDPAELPGVSAVVSLTGRYAARAACWTFEASGSRRLRPIERADIDQWPRQERASSSPIGLSLDPAIGDPPIGGSTPGAETRDSSRFGEESQVSVDPGPRLRLAGEGPIAVPSGDVEVRALTNSHHTGRSGEIRQQLSDEELQMLLASDPERGQN